MKTFELNGQLREVSYGDLSDEDIATMVRMMCRSDLNHEAVCVAGRDRILHLSQKCKALVEAIEAVQDWSGTRVGDVIELLRN